MWLGFRRTPRSINNAIDTPLLTKRRRSPPVCWYTGVCVRFRVSVFVAFLFLVFSTAYASINWLPALYHVSWPLRMSRRNSCSGSATPSSMCDVLNRSFLLSDLDKFPYFLIFSFYFLFLKFFIQIKGMKMDVMIISPDERRWLYCAISFSFWDSKPLLWSIFPFLLIVFIIFIFLIIIFLSILFGREMRSLSPYDRIWFQLCYNFLNYISQISDLFNFGNFFVFSIYKFK